MLRGSVKPLTCALAAFILLGTLSAQTVFADDNEFEFTGTISSLPATSGFIGDWVVAGRTVHVTSATRIEDGTPAVGKRVDVEGTLLNDGSVNATEIEVKSDTEDGINDFLFRGRLETLPGTADFTGDWVVSGRTIHVDSDTFIQQVEAPLAVGVPIKVIGTLLPDGTIDARKVQTEKKEHPWFFEFTGAVGSLPNTSDLTGDWVVGGRTVHVTSLTDIDREGGQITVGTIVEVKGTVRADGSVDAIKIEREGAENTFEFHGVVNGLPNTTDFVGDWNVGGRTVHVTPSTRIEQDEALLAVGALVEVKGTLRPDGSVDATEIEVERSATEERPVPTFELHGVVEQLPNTPDLVGDWVVSGRTVHVTSATLLNPRAGAVAVGTFVEVRGTLRTDNTIDATTIEVEHAQGNGQLTPFFALYGLVEMLPAASNFVGDWVVSGRTIHVSSETQVLGRHRPLVAGAFVKVVGTLRADGSIDARKIQVKRGDSTSRRLNFFEMFGTVEAAPASGFVGDWRVSGLVVHTTSSTHFAPADSVPAVGSRVKVTGRLRADGTLDADSIVVQGDDEDSDDFVLTHYEDFLNRDPDSSGFAFWKNEIEKCGQDAQCREVRRINVSAAFFHSIEFQRTGYLIYKMYVASFGRMPRLAEFLADVRTIGEGVVVGQPNWQETLEANTREFFEDWVSHPSFVAAFGGLTNAQYVDALLANAHLTLTTAERDALISGLDSGALSRADVLRQIVENPRFHAREFNRAFVLMQYFGYLRRDPDPAPDGNLNGLNFWLDKLNQFGGNFVNAEMVKAFLQSAEYRRRFGK
ncbi:MAG TPA: DUF5666 domain-containing protein [Pyrinomonadaceae bacterium]|nr:DUF5666 domain-containing protein [Pyrinomonadaceae bacterium]